MCQGAAAALFPPPRKCLQASLSSTAAGNGGRAGAAPVRGPRRLYILVCLRPKAAKGGERRLRKSAPGRGPRPGTTPAILARGRRAAPAPRALPRAAAASLVSRGKNQEGSLPPSKIHGKINIAAESRRHAPGRWAKRAVGARRGRFGGRPPPPAAFGSDPPPRSPPVRASACPAKEWAMRGMGARRRRGSRTAGTGGGFRDGEGFAAGTEGR